jgi:hypothetical protein
MGFLEQLGSKIKPLGAACAAILRFPLSCNTRNPKWLLLLLDGPAENADRVSTFN